MKRQIHRTATAADNAEYLERHEQNRSDDVVDPTADKRVFDDKPCVEIPRSKPQEQLGRPDQQGYRLAERPALPTVDRKRGE